MIHKVKMAAVIPTVQYGNIQPEVSFEGEDLEDLYTRASEWIERVWTKYASAPLPIRKPQGVEIETFTGEKILFNADTHEYFDLKGNRLVSGSQYAKQFEKPFDAVMMAERTGKSWGVDVAELASWWKMNAKISTEFGSAVHTALEAFHRFGKMGEAVQAMKNGKLKEGETAMENYCLPKNAHLRKIVLDFVAEFGYDALPELFVSDVSTGRVGQIDRLKVLDAEKKVARVQDYKSNNELTKEKCMVYQHQLSFYAAILKAHGWTIEGLDLFHHDGDKWTLVSFDVLPLSGTPEAMLPKPEVKVETTTVEAPAEAPKEEVPPVASAPTEEATPPAPAAPKKIIKKTTPPAA